MKANCKYEGRFPDKSRVEFKIDLRGLDAALMVAPLVKAFSQTMDANFTQSKEKPKLRKLVITVIF
jgi:hypothetical protein